MQALARAGPEPRGAARDPQDRRPGQGPADGRARPDASRRPSPSSSARPWPQRLTMRAVAEQVLAGELAPPTPCRPCHEGHARRRQLADLPGLLRPATDLATASGPGHQRRVRVHVDADQPACATTSPTGIVVAFDRPEPTFRHEAGRHYKANRSEAPDILRQQMGLVRQVVEALRLPDRRAGRASRPTTSSPRWPPRPATAGDDVVIVTGDRDSYQLVEDPHVKVLYNKRGVSDYALYDEAGIVERTGVHARRSTSQYAALRGDPSDNLPGVPGRGGEDGGQADQHLRRPRRHLRPRRRADPEAAARTWPSTRPQVRSNAELMVLRPRRRPRRAPRATCTGAGRPRRGARAVRLPRVPLAGRPPGRGVRRAIWPAAPPRGRGARGRGRPSWSTPPRPSSVLARAGRGRRAPGRGRARGTGPTTAARPLVGVAVVRDAAPGRRGRDPGRRPAGRPGAWPARSTPWWHPAVARVAVHDAKALMRALLDRGIDAAHAAARHRARRLPARPGRDPLRARRPAASATPG